METKKNIIIRCNSKIKECDEILLLKHLSKIEREEIIKTKNFIIEETK